MFKGKVVRKFRFDIADGHRKSAWVKSMDEYKELYKQSIEDPETFWADMAEQFYWEKKWDKVRDYNYSISKGPIFIEWFKNGKTNIAYNCLDRHLETRGDQAAFIWEGNNVGEDLEISYKQLHEKVCRFANALKAKGVGKGDRVAIYMPMIPELAVTMLACARIGAIHSVVFGGFSAEALSDRIMDSLCKVVVTADGVMRANKAISLKEIADTAMVMCEKRGHSMDCCFVVKRLDSEVKMYPDRDIWWHEAVAEESSECPVEWMDAEDPLFILYTSGSTGKPKGVQHNVGGYMVYTGTTFKYVFDYHDNDVYWCTADIGWITGHSYVVYGPLSQGATSLMFEGVPTYPDPGRFWATIDKWKVNQFYTAPTAIRTLIAQGEEWVERYDLSSLRLLGSVGEPINPEAWKWYHKYVGKEKCPIMDTWWQTETGGIMISALPYAIEQKPGSATLPFFSVCPVLLDVKGNVLEGACDGILALKEPWPGQMRTVYNNHDRFEETYFQMFDGFYFTGDGCRRDEDGYHWITGRVDDVINVSGHRMGTEEIESALVSHKQVAEAAVVGFPHAIKGQGIYAFVTLIVSAQPSAELLSALKDHVRKQIGPIATPDVIHFAPALPKTNSGKIMRRILRQIVMGESDQLGDISTLADLDMIDSLIKKHRELL
ncbi:MAG: acetate--CoA ligase [Desulfobacteraceae bacterium]|nr:acetate--CoA ligase [Desulfobacteraceae bacterium]